MKKFLTIIFIPAISFAQPGCESVGASMETELFYKLSKELKIDTSGIDEYKAKVELINISPISKAYATYLAKLEHEESLSKSKLTLPESEYFSSYYENEVKSITAQYTYFNKDKKKAVFIATSLMNKDECSIRFNGYITLSREF
ncbi:Shiga toxin A subunit [Atlantibacter sp.]|uniref:Shiga toxin A subunit n=1 Tax=Atlantibacter sp. TaxID=1903473 RepID=UPI0028AD4ACA|nr:Shiga toxin A subunit [Atlantibacter sp.]